MIILFNLLNLLNQPTFERFLAKIYYKQMVKNVKIVNLRMTIQDQNGWDLDVVILIVINCLISSYALQFFQQ